MANWRALAQKLQPGMDDGDGDEMMHLTGGSARPPRGPAMPSQGDMDMSMAGSASYPSGEPIDDGMLSQSMQAMEQLAPQSFAKMGGKLTPEGMASAIQEAMQNGGSDGDISAVYTVARQMGLGHLVSKPGNAQRNPQGALKPFQRQDDYALGDNGAGATRQSYR